MAASVKWDGLEQLKDELRRLPMELRDEGAAIVHAHARAAQQDIIQAYPDVSGSLRRGVRLTLNAVSRYGAGAVIKSSAPHAWLYEHGTVARATKQGWARGTMPEAPVGRRAVPIMIRWRARMYAQLAALLERHGLRVSGSIGRTA